MSEEQAHLKKVAGIPDKKPSRISAQQRMLELAYQRLEEQKVSA